MLDQTHRRAGSGDERHWRKLPEVDNKSVMGCHSVRYEAATKQLPPPTPVHLAFVLCGVEDGLC